MLPACKHRWCPSTGPAQAKRKAPRGFGLFEDQRRERDETVGHCIWPGGLHVAQSSGANKWIVPAAAGLLAAGGAALIWKMAGRRHTLETLADSVPGRAFLCVEVDVRDQKPWPELERQIADARRQTAVVEKSCKELENRFGMPFNDLLETFSAAGYVALLPPAGKTEIDLANSSRLVDAVVVLPVEHHDRAEAILAKTRPTGAKDQSVGGLTFTTEPKSGAVYTLSAHGLLFASSSEILKEAVVAFEEHKSTLADSAQFKTALSQVAGLGGSSGGLVFLDNNQVWNSLGQAFPAYVDKNTVQALHALPYSISGFFLINSSWRGEAFLPVVPGSDAFTRAVLNPPKGNAQLAGLIPSAWGFYQSLQLFHSFDSLSELVRIFPLGSVGLNMALGRVGATPGNPIYDRVRQTFNGEIAYALDLPTLFQSATESFAQARLQGQTTACESNCKNIAAALEMYSTDDAGHYPHSMNQLLGADYLKTIPTCPAAGNDTYSASYEVATEPNAFSFSCTGNHHVMGEGKPLWNSLTGLVADAAPPPAAAAEPKMHGALVLGLRSADKAAELQEYLLKSAGGKAETIKIEGHDAFRLAAGKTEACWCVLPTPPAVVLAFGPQARESLAEVLDLSQNPQSSVAQQPVFEGSLRGARGTVVSSQFLDLHALAGALESLGQSMERDKPGSTKDWGPLAAVDAKSFQPQAAYSAVEQDGVRFVSTGGGATGAAAVVGGLAAIGVPNFIKARGQGQLTACKSNEKNVATALEMYASDNAGRYPLEMNQLTPEYLKVIPTCPEAGQDTYSRSYKASTNPDSFSFCCLGQNHAGSGLPADYPAYSSDKGLKDGP